MSGDLISAEVMSALHLYLDGVVDFAICCIGLVINAVAIVMLVRTGGARAGKSSANMRSRVTKHHSIFLNVMISLATYDAVYLLLFAVCYTLPNLSKNYHDYIHPWLIPILMPITQMSFLGSIFTTVALTLERYIAVVLPFFRQRHNLKAWMFLVPVAVFVTLYSLPRFFELETVQRRRPLCSTFSESSIDNLSFSTITSHPNMDVLRFSNTIFKENDSLQITEYWNYNTNCNASEIEEQLSMNYVKFNETMHHFSIKELKDKCNLFKISKDSADTSSYGFQYPLINDYNGECDCDKFYYEPSEMSNCTCIATNEMCNSQEVAPLLNVTEMRTNPYYISIYVNWMSFIINCILPLALLIGMNIRIYLTMKNQWSMPLRVENSIKQGSNLNEKQSPQQVTMDPLGNIIEGIPEDEVHQKIDQHFEIDPQILGNSKNHGQKVPLIKRFFTEDNSNSLRRTSSFMLRSRNEGGGKFMKAINRIKDSNRKKKVRLTFRSSSKRGCCYGEGSSQINLQDVTSKDDSKSKNGDLSMSPLGQSTYVSKNDRVNCQKQKNRQYLLRHVSLHSSADRYTNECDRDQSNKGSNTPQCMSSGDVEASKRGKLERCKSVDPKQIYDPNIINKSNSGSSLRYTSVRKHGGGGFRGQDLEKEVRKRDRAYTRASVVMVAVFVVAHLPRFIANICELKYTLHFPEWAEALVMINNLLTILNSSFNFLIYLSFCGKQKKKQRSKYTSTYLTTTTTQQSVVNREPNEFGVTSRKSFNKKSTREHTRSGDSISDHTCSGRFLKDPLLHHTSERIIQSVDELTVLETTSAANDSINKIDTDLM